MNNRRLIYKIIFKCTCPTYPIEILTGSVVTSRARASTFLGNVALNSNAKKICQSNLK